MRLYWSGQGMLTTHLSPLTTSSIYPALQGLWLFERSLTASQSPIQCDGLEGRLWGQILLGHCHPSPALTCGHGRLSSVPPICDVCSAVTLILVTQSLAVRIK